MFWIKLRNTNTDILTKSKHSVMFSSYACITNIHVHRGESADWAVQVIKFNILINSRGGAGG